MDNQEAKIADTSMASPREPSQVVLVLQGGGALGAYQIGVYQALEEAGYLPDWVAGTSIGAINAALIVGNEPGQRLAKLKEFWSMIRWPDLLPAMPGGILREWANGMAALQAALFGQPNFFRPRFGNPWLSGSALGLYDTQPLRATLESLIDFKRINAGPTRLSVGAVNVATGEPFYFDSARITLGPEHILASGALPPAFPPVEIDGAWYWDGGVVSNTPLDTVIDDLPRRSSLVFMVDLFARPGTVPKSMADVELRRNDINYAPRSRRDVEKHRQTHNLRRAVNVMWEYMPEALKQDPRLMKIAELRCATTMQIVQIQSDLEGVDGSGKDHDFSAATISQRHALGYRDTCRLLENQTWKDKPAGDLGLLVYGASCSPEGAKRIRHSAAKTTATV